ncbi:MAG TPA: ATP synthase F1 subunit gamma [Chitinispirillaceae bacterium]|nr:ATP synthase F1 subunit gamma [Chitinispirillaceae bacterium]
MHGIREYNDKIKSLKNTRKITGSMKMVSTVKFQKFSRLKTSAINFAQSIDAAASTFFKLVDSANSENPDLKEPSKKALIIFFTSDRGLCGRYNSNVFRETLKVNQLLKKENIDSVFCCSGSKGLTYLSRYKLQCRQFFSTASSNPDAKNAHEIARFCLDKYQSGEVNSVYLVYSRRKSSLEEPVSLKVFPVQNDTEATAQNDDAVSISSLLLENKPEIIKKHLSQMKMFASVYRALVESAESEHSARMSAMETATTNCDKMIQNYQQLRNRARQTAITTELSEIVTGKEALEHN